MTENKKEKKALTPADKLLNGIIAGVIVLVLALAVWAVTPKVMNGWKNAFPPDVSKISGMAKSLDMTVDEFKAEFGLSEDVTEKSLTEDVLTDDFVRALPLAKYVKLAKTDFATLTEQMGLTGKVTEETTFGEAELLVPLRVMAGNDEGFAQMKEYYGFEEGVTADTPYGEVKDFIAAVDAQKAAEAEAAAAAEAEAANSEAPVEGEEAPAENAEVPAEGEEAPAENAEAPAENAE